MTEWPYCSMPEWFARSFEQYLGIANALNWNKPEPDYKLAAEKFWREIVRREDYPAPEFPDLRGGIGGIICPACPQGRGSTRTEGCFDQAMYTCNDCGRQYVIFNERLEPLMDGAMD